MKTYSIIIPHKDIPDLLRRCLDSIPPRPEAEIIVVDDLSNSMLVDFEHFPGLERPDVKCIFTKEGRGAGYARNVGLRHAEGKWLLFADADDFFHEGMWEMLDQWKDTDNDIVFFNTDSVISESLQPTSSRESAINSLSDIELKYHYLPPWGVLTNREFIESHTIRFKEIKHGNDVDFSTMRDFYTTKIASDIHCLYCATKRENSLTNPITRDSVISYMNTHYRRRKFLEEHHIRCNHQNSALYYLISAQHFDWRTKYKAWKLFIKNEKNAQLLKGVISVLKYRHKSFRKRWR